MPLSFQSMGRPWTEVGQDNILGSMEPSVGSSALVFLEDLRALVLILLAALLEANLNLVKHLLAGSSEAGE